MSLGTRKSAKEEPVWRHVAASEASTSQVLAPLGLVAAGEFAADDGGAQLPLSEVVGCIHGWMIEKGEEVIALFAQPLAHLFLDRCGLTGIYDGSGRPKQAVRVGFQGSARTGNLGCV